MARALLPAKTVWICLGLVLGFAAILAYFRVVDVYDTQFFSPDVTLAYNLIRILFIPYLFAAICAPGYAVLSLPGMRAGFVELPAAARLTAAFFAGAAVWHALLLILGFLELYYYPVAVALSVAAVALAAFCLPGTLAEPRRDAAPRKSAATARWTARLLAAGIVGFALVLLLVKGLYPAGGHDYYNHYHGYYEAVLRNHGLQPNEVWYQFYYSKGMGLFFLASLLTDPLAPALVTYCFAVATALALYLLIDRMAPQASFWPAAAVIVYFALYTYTPGFGIYRANGGWGDFEKPHEIGAAVMVGFLWACAALPGAAGRQRRVWFAVAAASIAISPFVELADVLLLGLAGAVLAAIALRRRRWGSAAALLGLCAIGAVGLAAVLLVNVAATGLASDQFALRLTAWTRVQPLAEWGALPHLLTLMRDARGMQAGAIDPLSWRFVMFCHDVLRLDLLKPLLIGTPLFLLLLAGAAALRGRRLAPTAGSWPLAVLLVFIAVVIVAAAAAGRTQPISFYRYCTFCLPVVIGAIACGWLYIAGTLRAAWLSRGLRYLMPLVVAAVALGQFWADQGRFLVQMIPSAFAFARGAASIRAAYADQQGWPGRQVYGGIFPGTVGAWRAAGPGTRVWSMHLWAYCMLPHCRWQTYYSFILSPHLLDLLAGSGEETHDTLRREGLNYFFYTSKLPVNDILPLTGAFAPEAIARYVGVKWTDGTSYLLTWLGPGVTPLSPEWVARYKQAVADAPDVPRGFPLAAMLDLRRQLRDRPRYLGDLDLPGITMP